MRDFKKMTALCGKTALIFGILLFLSACALPAVSGGEMEGTVPVAESEAKTPEDDDQGDGEEAAEGQGAAGQAADGQEDAGPADGAELPEAQTLPGDGQDHEGKYYYGLLDEDEKLWYADIYAVLEGMYEDVALSPEANDTVGEDKIDRIFQSVMNDYPGLFFVKGYTYTRYSYGGRTARITFSGTYTMDQDERQERQEKIDAAVERCLAGIAAAASDYEKVRYVYEYVILNTEYRQGAEDSQNIYSVLVNGKSVCQGYAKTTQYLLEELGIPATLVAGTVYGGESHAWNLVMMDGDYYYVDTTWGDASYRLSEESSMAVGSLPEISYDYLGLTTKQLLLTHVIDADAVMPECVAVRDNYYVREGAYFTGWDEAAVAAFFAKGYEQGKKNVTLKCADGEVYRLFFDYLIAQQHIFDYLSSPDGVIAYAEDPDKYALTFWLVNE